MSHGAQTRLTPHMRDILKIVVKGNTDGSFCDLDQILGRIIMNRSKQSIQFTIRTLIKKGLIAKKDRQTRRGRSRVIIVATEMGYEMAHQHYSPESAEELNKLFEV